MEDNISVKKFFSKLSCTQCTKNFTEDSVTVMRQENNYTVVRIKCAHCGKNIGLAILGLDKNEIQKSVELCSDSECINVAQSFTPIDYDDVIDAHQFFNNLGSDWSKHVPEDKII